MFCGHYYHCFLFFFIPVFFKTLILGEKGHFKFEYQHISGNRWVKHGRTATAAHQTPVEEIYIYKTRYLCLRWNRFFILYYCVSLTFECYPGIIDEDVHSSILLFKEGSSGGDAVHVVDVQLVEHRLQSLRRKRLHRFLTTITEIKTNKLSFTSTWHLKGLYYVSVIEVELSF